IIWGLRPGPMLFVEHPDFVWGLIGSLYMANIFTVIINIAFIPLFVKVLVTPLTILAPVIFVLCLVGGYAPQSSLHDVWLMILFGVSGYILRKLDYPVAPAVLAIVLGGIAESSLRQSLISSRGDPTTFIERPISATIVFLAVALILTPVIRKLLSKKIAATAGAGDS